MFHAKLHPVHINFYMAADGGNQVISKRFKLRWGQIRSVMDEDKLKAFLGAVSAVFLSEEFIQKRHDYFLPASF
jgi:hypothetical protein